MNSWKKMIAIHYRKYRDRDLAAATRLVRDVSKRYFHRDIKSAEGRKFWKDLQSLRKDNMPRQEELFNGFSIKIVVECDLKKLVGIIAGKPDEVVMLFVRPSFQHKGIASALYSRFQHKAGQQGSRLIRVKSSRYAEAFYRKVGFTRTGPEKEICGLPVVPMETRI